MTPKQKNSYILDIKNIDIFYLPFWKEVKQIIITTILILIGTVLKILGRNKVNIKHSVLPPPGIRRGGMIFYVISQTGG